MAARRLILASQSPRRAQLLREAGFVFEQMSPPFADPDQPDPHHDPAKMVAELALKKAQSLQAQVRDETAVILAADTVCVDMAGSLLGKPQDRADAERMLRLLIGGQQRVITGVAMLNGSQVENFSDEAQVHCGPVSEAQLQLALDGGGWQGKAGGYNLFDLQAAGWPLTVVGDETTVVGLPMGRVGEVLRGMLKKKWRKDTPRNRRLVVAWATLGCILPFSLCAVLHYCMCGHMAHESNHTRMDVANDVVWTTLFAMAVVFVGKSDAQGKLWIRYGLSAAVLFSVLMLPVGVLWMPVVAFYAIRSLFGGAKDWTKEPQEVQLAHRKKVKRWWGIAAISILLAIGSVWGGYHLFWGIRRALVPRIYVTETPFVHQYGMEQGDAYVFQLPNGGQIAVWCVKKRFNDPFSFSTKSDCEVKYGDRPFDEFRYGQSPHIRSEGTIQSGRDAFGYQLKVDGLPVGVEEIPVGLGGIVLEMHVGNSLP